MVWDAHNGKWRNSTDGYRDIAASGEPSSPTRKPRAVSPARPGFASAVSVPLPNGGTGATAAGAAAMAQAGSSALHAAPPSRRRGSGSTEDTFHSTPVDDADLPGWLVLQRTTNTGRSYKVYHGPNGEYAESKRQAMLLASGQPLSAAQLAFKSKPASRTVAPGSGSNESFASCAPSAGL